jgi:hypothetical protein
MRIIRFYKTIPTSRRQASKFEAVAVLPALFLATARGALGEKE